MSEKTAQLAISATRGMLFAGLGREQITQPTGRRVAPSPFLFYDSAPPVVGGHGLAFFQPKNSTKYNRYNILKTLAFASSLRIFYDDKTLKILTSSAIARSMLSLLFR